MDPTYRIETVAGVEAIRCLLCNRISELPDDVQHRYCGRCHLFHEDLALARQMVAAGGGHDCAEWWTYRGTCALCGRPRHEVALIDGDPTLTSVTPLRCPYCGYQANMAGTTDGEAGAPSDGDACGCIACGGPMTFHPDPLTGAWTLRKMTQKEADDLTADQRQELARVQWFATHVYQPHKRAGRN